MTSNATAGPPPRAVFGAAAALGLVCGALDVSLAILRRMQSYEDLTLVFPPVFATAFALGALLCAAWWLAGRRAVTWFGLQSEALLTALATTIGSIFVFARIGNFPLQDVSAAEMFALLLYGGLGCVAGIAAYLAGTSVATSTRLRAIVATSLVAAPALLLEILLFLWAQLYWIESAKSPAGVGATLALVAALTGTSWFAFRRGDTGHAARAVWVASAVAFSIPFVVAGYAGLSSRAGGETVHPVRHVILISADTMRADVLGPYGNTHVPTPALDALARDGAVFEHTMSVAPWTLPALGTLVSGVSPAVHLMRAESDRLPASVTTLAERFAAAGYHTGAIVDNAYLRPKANLAQGFVDYVFLDVPEYGQCFGALLLRHAVPWLYRPQRPSTIAEHTAAVTKWLDRNADRDFFLWVHYFDPHAPYEPPRDYVEGEPPPGMGHEFVTPPQIMSNLIVRSEAEKTWIRKLYEGEVRRVDDNIGIVLARLRELALYDDAVILFTSDHGEEFWEHGAHGHAHTLYNELLHVPLILKSPGVPGSSRVASRVSLERVSATLLEAADVEYDPRELSGPSLLPLLQNDGAAGEPIPIVSASSLVIDDQESVIFDEMKYIHSLISGDAQFFDLRTDAGEQHSLLSAQPDAAVRARKLLVDNVDAAAGLRERIGVGEGETAALDPATLNRLRGLGYIK